jgi:hypothetical protein
MKRILGLQLAVLLLLPVGTFAYDRGLPPGEPPAGRMVSPVSFTFGIAPIGIGSAMTDDDFTATTADGTESATEDGGFVFSPLFFMGVDVDGGTGGIGFDGFVSSFAMGDNIEGSQYGANVSIILPHLPEGRVRSRLKAGVFRGRISWDHDPEVDFKAGSGWQAGVGVEFGRRVPFYMEMLYRRSTFEVDEEPEVVTSDDELSFAGPVLNIGIKFNF